MNTLDKLMKLCRSLEKALKNSEVEKVVVEKVIDGIYTIEYGIWKMVRCEYRWRKIEYGGRMIKDG